jgi:hypothetical protein
MASSKVGLMLLHKAPSAICYNLSIEALVPAWKRMPSSTEFSSPLISKPS